MGLCVQDHDPVYKVTIIPRGIALGLTMFLPEQDRYSFSKRRLVSQITSLFGGRAAEELIFGKDSVTTGASNDIEKATDIARKMVTKWGLSKAVGPLKYGEDEGSPFLGRTAAAPAQNISGETAKLIDKEVKSIIDTCYGKAENILKEFNIDYEIEIVSAHRTPEKMMDYSKNAHKRGINVIIAGAGGAAHLPGMVASNSPLPVIGVPVKSRNSIDGWDSILSILQMPGGVPVATVALDGAKNAGILAVEIIGSSDSNILDKIIEYKKQLEIKVNNSTLKE